MATAPLVSLDLQAEHELQGAPRAIAILFVGLHAFAPRAGRCGKLCRLWTRPARTGSSCRSGSATAASASRSPTIPWLTWPGLDEDQASTKLLWALDRPAQPSGGGAGRDRKAALPRADPADLERARPGTRTSAGGPPPWNGCGTSWPAAASPWWSPRPSTGWVAWARPSWPWSTRTGSWPTTTWSGGCLRSDPTRSAVALADLARKMGLQVGDNVAEAAEAALEELRRDTDPALAAHLRQRRRPEAAGALSADWLRARPDHVPQPGLDPPGRAAGGGRLQRGRERGPPAPARARHGPGRRQDGRGRSGQPAAGGRAGQCLAGADRDAAPGLRGRAQHPGDQDPGAEPAVRLPDPGRRDLEPFLRTAPAAVAGRRAHAATAGFLLAGAHLHGPAVQRRDVRGAAYRTTRASASSSCCLGSSGTSAGSPWSRSIRAATRCRSTGSSRQ